ncbi:MAG: sugar isomerase [Fibrobacteres bacterium]|nr:sugar isomerase [Fibrobacterota bacterium]
MNLTDDKYSKYALVREMLETADVIRNFDPECAAAFADSLSQENRLFFTGEGSSRIFPAKRAMYEAMKTGFPLPMATDGATQAMEYDLSRHAVLAASNSGKTKEVVRLFKGLNAKGHKHTYGVMAHAGAPLAEISKKAHVLTCGPEKAVAATKSVVEQALFYQAVLAKLRKSAMTELPAAAAAVKAALELSIDPEYTKAVASAPVIYFSGRNNGVAEELTLKTNEITRKKSAFLEGTYAVHGIEEVMNPDEVVVLVEPFPDEEEKFSQVLKTGVGMRVIAISTRQTSFPTILIPSVKGYDEYVQLAAGWNLLVEVGIRLGIDPDKPVRARKVGNEFLG